MRRDFAGLACKPIALIFAFRILCIAETAAAPDSRAILPDLPPSQQPTRSVVHQPRHVGSLTYSAESIAQSQPKETPLQSSGKESSQGGATPNYGEGEQDLSGGTGIGMLGGLSSIDRDRASALIFDSPQSIPPHTVLLPTAQASIDRHPACAALYWDLPQGPSSIALVGNGPVSVADKASIERMDIVIRLNTMDSWSCGERLDVWMTRHSGDATLLWHGIGETRNCSTTEALAAKPFLWFFGDNAEGWYDENLLAEAVVAYPELAALPRAGISYSLWRTLFQNYIVTPSSPTTGWVGMMLTLDCAPENAAIHLFGFNWNKEQWHTHRIFYEQQFAEVLQEQGRIIVHRAPCKNLRECGD